MKLEIGTRISRSLYPNTTNLTSLYQSIQQNRPTGVKGKYFKSLFICASMGPSIQLDLDLIEQL